MRKSLLTGALVLLAALAVLAADRIAMFTEVVGPVSFRGGLARTLMPVATGEEVEVPARSRATLTFFRDGHRERLQGPCRVRLEASGGRLVAGAPEALTRTAGAPDTVLAPSGQNLRRMGGGLHALADPGSAEYAQLVALASPEDLLRGGAGAGQKQATPDVYLLEVEPPGAGPPLEAPAVAPPLEAPAVAPPLRPGPVEAPRESSVLESAPVGAPGAGPPPCPAPVVAPPPPVRLSEQRDFALAPTLSWQARGAALVSLERAGKVVWKTLGSGPQVTLPAWLPPGPYRWTVQTLDGSVPAEAEIAILPRSERERVHRAFEEARCLRDASAWALVMARLADQGLLVEAYRANREALLLRPRDAGLHLAAARLLLLLALEDRAREEARKGLELESRP